MYSNSKAAVVQVLDKFSHLDQYCETNGTNQSSSLGVGRGTIYSLP